MSRLVERGREIAEELQGTCDSLPDEVLRDETGVIAAELDQHVFQCACCGWWCELSEAVNVDDEDVCEDCAE